MILWAATTAPPPPRLPEMLLAWSPDPVFWLAVVAAGLLYHAGTRRLRARGDAWPRSRSVAFLAGLGVLVLVLVSPVDAYDTALFSVHILQHMTLTMLAAPLLMLGTPVTLLLRTVPPRMRRVVLRVVHSLPVRIISFPVVGWLLFTVTLYALYFTFLFDLSLRNELVHQAIHVHFLASGLLFWWPVVGLDPSRWRLPHGARILYVLLVVPFHAVLGLAIMNTQHLLAPSMAVLAPAWGPDPLADQQVGGAIMWGLGDLISGLSAILIMVSWARQDEREARRIDRHLDRIRQARPRPPS